MSKAIAPSEVAAHNTVDNGLYIIIDGNVYSMSGFIGKKNSAVRAVHLY